MSSYLTSEELDPKNTNRREEPAVGMCVYVCVCVLLSCDYQVMRSLYQ